MPTSDSITSTSGIYMITCVPTGKFYVGSAINLKHRWQVHRDLLVRGRHHSPHFQHAWNKYSSDAFDWTVLEYVEANRLIEREQHYLDLFQATLKGFNVCPIAGSNRGVKQTPESNAKRSASHRGKKRTPEQRARMSAAKRGIPLTIAHRHKIAEAGRGRKQTDEAKSKLAQAAHNISSETRDKRSKSLRGRIITVEQRAKIAQTLRGSKHTDEAKAKIAEASRGRKHTQEARDKIAEAARNISPETRAKRSQSLRGITRRHRPFPGQKEFEF